MESSTKIGYYMHKGRLAVYPLLKNPQFAAKVKQQEEIEQLVLTNNHLAEQLAEIHAAAQHRLYAMYTSSYTSSGSWYVGTTGS